jgi:hypothetical protein
MESRGALETYQRQVRALEERLESEGGGGGSDRCVLSALDRCVGQTLTLGCHSRELAASHTLMSSKTPSPSFATRSGGWRLPCDRRWRPATRSRKPTSRFTPSLTDHSCLRLTQAALSSPVARIQGPLTAGHVDLSLGNGREALTPGAPRVVTRPAPAAALANPRGARRVSRKGHARARHRDAGGGQRAPGRGPDAEGSASVQGRRRVKRDLSMDVLTPARAWR